MKKRLFVLLLCAALLLTQKGLAVPVNLPVIQSSTGFREVIQSMAWVQGALYGLSGQSLFYAIQGEQYQQLEIIYDRHLPMPSVDPRGNSPEYVKETFEWIQTLFSDGERLYGLSAARSGALYALHPRGDTCEATLTVALDWSGIIHDINQDNCRCLGAVLDGDTLYLALEHPISTEEGQRDVSRLYAFSMLDGSCQPLCDGIVSIAPGPSGQLFCTQEIKAQQEYALVFYHMATGEITTAYEKLPFAFSRYSAIGYDPTTRTAYLPTADGVIASVDSGAWKLVYPIALENYSGFRLALAPGRALALADLGIYVRDLNDTAPLTPDLTILGGDEDGYQKSVKALHPERHIRHTVSYGNIAQRFSQDMINHDPSVDIYELPLGPAFTRLMARGFYMPLDSEALSRFRDALYDDWKPYPLDSQGQLAAFPKEIRQSGLGISRHAASLLGIELNNGVMTYDQLLGALDRYMQEGEAHGLHLIHFRYSGDLRTMLLGGILDSFAALYQRQPQEAMVFSGELIALMERADSILSAIPAHERRYNPYGTSSIGNQLVLNPEPEYLLADTVSLMPGFQAFDNGRAGYCLLDYVPLRLTLTKESEPLLSAAVTVFVISPYSQRKAEAMAYLADYQQCKQTDFPEQGNIRTAAFFRGFEQQPSEVCRVHLLRLNGEMDIVRRRYEGLPEYAVTLQDELDALQRQIDSLEPFVWQTTPEAVQRYLEALPLIAFRDESALYDAIDDAWRACVNHKTSIRDALETMFHVLRQMELEDM